VTSSSAASASSSCSSSRQYAPFANERAVVSIWPAPRASSTRRARGDIAARGRAVDWLSRSHGSAARLASDPRALRAELLALDANVGHGPRPRALCGAPPSSRHWPDGVSRAEVSIQRHGRRGSESELRPPAWLRDSQSSSSASKRRMSRTSTSSRLAVCRPRWRRPARSLAKGAYCRLLSQPRRGAGPRSSWSARPCRGRVRTRRTPRAHGTGPGSRRRRAGDRLHGLGCAELTDARHRDAALMADGTPA